MTTLTNGKMEKLKAKAKGSVLLSEDPGYDDRAGYGTA